MSIVIIVNVHFVVSEMIVWPTVGKQALTKKPKNLRKKRTCEQQFLVQEEKKGKKTQRKGK